MSCCSVPFCPPLRSARDRACGPGRRGPARAATAPLAARWPTSTSRGSSLLLVGRFISLGLNFVVQVLIARYLTEGEYGAWAYALSLVILGETVATLGLDRGASRFLAVYDERADYARLAGTLLLVLGTALSLGAAVVALVIGGRGLLDGEIVGSDQVVSLLVLLIVLAPVQAVDNLLGGVLAVLTKTRIIFWRKYVMGPLLRLVVVLLLVLTSQGVHFLAVGYVAAGGSVSCSTPPSSGVPWPSEGSGRTSRCARRPSR